MKRNSILLTLLIIGACTILPAAEPVSSPGAPVLVVIVRDFSYPEYHAVTENLMSGQSVPIMVASLDTGVVTATNDSTARAEMTIASASPGDFSGLMLIGGIGTVLLWKDSTVARLIQGFDRLGKPIGAIGIAPILLAKAGILQGRAAAVMNDFEAIRMVKAYGARFSYREVVRDRTIVTGRDAEAGAKFAQAFRQAWKAQGN